MPRPIALTKLAPRDYVLIANRTDPTAEQTVWKLRPLPYAVRLQLMSTMTVDAREAGSRVTRLTPDVGKRYDLACRYGLAGWENFSDGNGGETVPTFEPKKQFGLQVLDDAALAKLPDNVLQELGLEIIELSSTPQEAVGE